MRRILSVLLENESGALSRVVGLFSQRGYNIETLNVAPTDDHSLSRLTVTTTGDDLKIEQITKHLNKIVDVVKVVDLTEGAHVERDTLLVKVRAVDAQRDEVKRTAEIFENLRSTFDFIALRIHCTNLHQQRIALNVRALCEVHHLHHVHNLIEMLGDLLDLEIIACGSHSQSGQRVIIRGGDVQRFDVVTALRE